MPSATSITPIGQLHQSPPSPIPGDQRRNKRRGFSPGAAARNSQSARANLGFPKQHPFSPTKHIFPRFFRIEQKGEGRREVKVGKKEGIKSVTKLADMHYTRLYYTTPHCNVPNSLQSLILNLNSPSIQP